VPSSLEFLRRFSAKVTIADLSHRVARGDPPAGSEAGEWTLEEVTLPGGEIRFDVVLAWDLFNYLERPAAERLVGLLRSRCRPDALLLALMWTTRRIPERPLRFHIDESDQLRYEAATRSRCDGPGYATADVERLFSGFRVISAFLLRHGVQEYLLGCHGDG
jgi:hypothetical protein